MNLKKLKTIGQEGILSLSVTEVVGCQARTQQLIISELRTSHTFQQLYLNTTQDNISATPVNSGNKVLIYILLLSKNTFSA